MDFFRKIRPPTLLTDDPADELEVEEMVVIGVGGGVDHVGHSVPRGGAEEGVHRVEDLA